MISLKGFYFVNDRETSAENTYRNVISALDAGVHIIKYTDKEATNEDFLERATIIKQLCLGRARFIIDYRVEVADKIFADGVHLGKDTMLISKVRKLLGTETAIGVTVKTSQKALSAIENGADYLSVGPIYHSNITKESVEKLNLISQIKAKSKIPVVAFGGINLVNVKGVITAGADAVSAISSVMSSTDLTEEIKKYQILFE